MLSERAFRAQLVTQGQRELYDYWRETAGVRAMPARSEINPFGVPKLFPCIGLIDLTGGLEEARFRLAGTRLRDIYGEEITGKRIDGVFAGARADYWREVHAQVADEGSPLHGVIRGPAQGREHIVLFWLRLPLSQDGAKVDRIFATTRWLRSRLFARRPTVALLAPAHDRRCGPRAGGRNAARPKLRAAHQPKLGLVGRHQPKVTIELVAPVACKRAPALGAQGTPELGQDQQAAFRALISELVRP